MTDGGGFCPASCCEECGSLSFSLEWYQAFNVVLCNQCKRDEALISKAGNTNTATVVQTEAHSCFSLTRMSHVAQGNAMALYCLTAKDLAGLGCITKDNPQKKSWSAMKLYLKKQVEERARRKHGDLEALRQLRHDRAQAKAQGWLAKRARAGEGGGEDGEDAGGEEEEEGGDGADSRAGRGGSPAGGAAVRVRLSGAAARVRARLASEYEGATPGAAGSSGAPAPAATAAADEGDDVEVF